MAISGDYPQPVQVNGFSCKNCTDVDYAKKHIDPAHPKDGPYGIDAKNNDTKSADTKTRTGALDRPAVTFGGSLGVPNPGQGDLAPQGATATRVDVSV
jgi:hypothetical protein